jgi:hypothetical protein
MEMHIYDFLRITIYVVISLAILIALFTTNKRTSKEFKILLFFLIATGLNTLIIRITSNHQIRNHFIQNIYNYIRFPLLAWAYFHFFKTRHSNWYKISFALWLMTPLLIVYSLIHNGWNTLNTPYMVAGSVFVIICALLYFYFLFNADNVLQPFRFPLFWSSVGFFFYFLSILPSFGIFNLLMADDLLLAKRIFILSNAMGIILYSLISLDFLIQWKQQKNSTF